MGEEYLLIGALLVLALGGSLLLGTVAAMVQAKRTGRAPGRDKPLAQPVASPGIVVRLALGGVGTLAGLYGVWWWFA